MRQGEYICTLDYQGLYGTRCFSCQDFIEGEVVSALGKTYHPRCFVCSSCKYVAASVFLPLVPMCRSSCFLSVARERCYRNSVRGDTYLLSEC